MLCIRRVESRRYEEERLRSPSANTAALKEALFSIRRDAGHVVSLPGFLLHRGSQANAILAPTPDHKRLKLPQWNHVEDARSVSEGTSAAFPTTKSGLAHFTFLPQAKMSARSHLTGQGWAGGS